MGSNKVEVVISGISGKFPECDGLEELEVKLFNKEDLIAPESGKWNPGELGVPAKVGKFKTKVELDNMFFRLHNKLHDVMDPTTTQSMKGSYEAICDAGINPNDLSGSNVAVIMSSFISETEYRYVNSETTSALVGQSRTMQSNRVSFFFNFTGPSYVVDTTWNGGLQAIQLAHQLISSGQCSAALVGACSLIFGPEISYLYYAMGKLNEDGKTKSFSADADGYTRSEGCVFFFLQRAQDAKRSYGSIVGIHSTERGDRQTSYTDFDPEQYRQVLEETYSRAELDPNEVAYVEADGSAAKILDAMELNTLAEVFCKNRETPLPIGCVKSNLGHTEASASMVAIVKALIALKTGIIPPNLHYSSPNPHVPALISGQLEVITEPKSLQGNIVAVSSFGLTGSYGHIIIKGNPRLKSDQTISNVPRLFVITGRQEEDLEKCIKKVESMPFNENYVRLSNDVFKSHMKGHAFKGYTILNTDRDADEIEHVVKLFDGKKKPIWFLFSGMGSQWPKMGVDLMVLPTFAKSIDFCHEVLSTKGIDLKHIITTPDSDIHESILNAFVGIAAIQIGLVDVLKELGVEPEGLVGHSVGELGCAYADGCFTAEQTILAAYARGKASIEVDLIEGMMAAVGKGYNEIKDELPPTIEVACHNSAKSCTLSGPAGDMEQYIASLKEKGVFAKLVNVANIAYHSRYIKPAAPVLLKYLQEVIAEPKERSKRWISSSVPESSWDSELARCSSAEYHTNNLLCPVLFEEASAHVPKDAIVIEIAPHGLLQSIVKTSLKDCFNISLTNKNSKNNVTHLLKSIGKLYLEGISINIEKLYPEIEFPVPANTPSIISLLTWIEKLALGGMKIQPLKEHDDIISIQDEKIEDFFDFKTGNKQMISSKLILCRVIEMFKKIHKDQVTQKPIKIENVIIGQHYIEVLKSLKSTIYTKLHCGSGYFEANLISTTLMSGVISLIDYEHPSNTQSETTEDLIIQNELLTMNCDEIYRYFEEFSILVQEKFRLIKNISMNITDLKAIITWRGNWVEFLDAIFMTVMLQDMLIHNEARTISSVRLIRIDFSYFDNVDFKEITVLYNRHTKELRCDGLKMLQPQTIPTKFCLPFSKLQEKSCQFLPYYSASDEKSGDIVSCLNVVLQNTFTSKNQKLPKLRVIVETDDDVNNEILSILTELSNGNQKFQVLISPDEDAMGDLYLQLDDTQSLLVIGELLYFRRVQKSFKKVRAGFLLLKQEINVEKWNPIHVVYKTKFNNSELNLYKICHTSPANANTVNMNDEDWLLELEDLLKKESTTGNKSRINVHGKITSPSRIYNILQVCSDLEYSHLIRFIFLDDNSPIFSLDKEFYKEQLKKDLLLNIYQNNCWGCLKVFAPQCKLTKSPDDCHLTIVYKLSSIKSENLRLKAIGMNLADGNEIPERRELGVFDYCGVDKSGKTVFGIGALSDNHQLIEDKILKWEKPKSWSDEDAATLPVFYSMAHYILKIKSNMVAKCKNILVHCGTELISQAVIATALPLGLEIFVTYRSAEEKEDILNLFPEIKKENLFECIDKSFEIPLRTMTQNNGIDLIVNPSKEHSVILASLRCIGRCGKFFQFNTDISTNQCKIGMFVFRKAIIFFVLPWNTLLYLSTSDKEIVQKELQNGIDHNYVKPLKYLAIPINSMNTDAVNVLVNLNEENNMKLLSNFNKNDNTSETNELYVCSNQRSYIVILKNDDKFSLDLICWLLNRGAKKLHLFAHQDLINSIEQRLICASSHLSIAEVKVHYIDALRNREDLKGLLRNDQLAEVFFIGKVTEDEVRTVDSSLREIQEDFCLVCIGFGGESVCETRHADGKPSLAISCDHSLLKSTLVLPELDKFINNNRSSIPVIILEEQNDSINTGTEKVCKLFERIPKDVTELKQLNKTIAANACFREVKSRSAAYHYNKGLSPIFILPGLRTNETELLASRLNYPTFQASLSQDTDDIQTISEELYKDLQRFSLKIFTLVTNDWGGAIGLSLAKKLEDRGNIVLLLMLNSSPHIVTKWVTEVLNLGDINLINKYIEIPYKIKKKLYLLPNWDEKLQFTIQNCLNNDSDRESIGNALNYLRKCLLAIKNYKPNSRYEGKYFVFVQNESQIEDNGEIVQFCKKKLEVKIIPSSGHQTMLDNSLLAEKINCLIPHHYKTAAHDRNRDIIGDYIRRGPRVLGSLV